MVLTVAGRLKWVKGAIETLRDPLDVLVVDDATPGNEIRDFCQEKGLAYITKPKPKGLTNSWNRAYQFFRENKYKRCILSNDDVRFPKGFSESLFDGLRDFYLVGPLSNQPGTGHKQRVGGFIDRGLNPDRIDRVQKALEEEYGSDPFIPFSTINGFCFAFSQVIQQFEFSNNVLFNPRRINTANEDELCRRINKTVRGRIAICKISYVWHFKGGTYKEIKLKDRNMLWRR